MNNIVSFNGSSKQHCGNVVVSVYKDMSSGAYTFDVKTDTDDILPVSYVIEDTLYFY